MRLKCPKCLGDVYVQLRDEMPAPPESNSGSPHRPADGIEDSSWLPAEGQSIPTQPSLQHSLRHIADESFSRPESLADSIGIRTSPTLIGIVLVVVVLLTVLWRSMVTEKVSVTGDIKTIESLTDASRRLEMRGYRRQKDSNSYGNDSTNYLKTATDASYDLSIGRWSGDPRLREVFMIIRGDYASCMSLDARESIWNVMKNDVCAMVRGRDDFQRAMDNMEPDSDDEMSGSHGEATTEDGWTIYLSEYGSYPKAMKNTTEMKIPLFCVILTNVAVDEDMPPGAQAEYNRQMGEAIEKGKKVRKELGLDP